MCALLHHRLDSRDRIFGKEDLVEVLKEMGGCVSFIPQRTFDHPTERLTRPLAGSEQLIGLQIDGDRLDSHALSVHGIRQYHRCVDHPGEPERVEACGKPRQRVSFADGTRNRCRSRLRDAGSARDRAPPCAAAHRPARADPTCGAAGAGARDGAAAGRALPARVRGGGHAGAHRRVHVRRRPGPRPGDGNLAGRALRADQGQHVRRRDEG